MSIQLTPEQFQALQSQPLPVLVEDPVSQAQYVIISRAEFVGLTDEECRREVQRGIDDADADLLEEGDVEAIIAEAQRQYAARNQQ